MLDKEFFCFDQNKIAALSHHTFVIVVDSQPNQILEFMNDDSTR
jgi:hypothetical protein